MFKRPLQQKVPFLPAFSPDLCKLYVENRALQSKFSKMKVKLYLKCTVSFGRNSWEIIRYEEFYKFILVFLWYVTIQKGMAEMTATDSIGDSELKGK